MGIIPSHMGDVCICVVYEADSPKRQEEAINLSYNNVQRRMNRKE